jgi:hypothetical protein
MLLSAHPLAQSNYGDNRDTRLWQTEPIFRYTCWNKETRELISSIT